MNINPVPIMQKVEEESKKNAIKNYTYSDLVVRKGMCLQNL
jgi:hypothetical protein